MNSVTITGRLTDEPELRHVAEGRPLCKMRVAVDNGRHPTTFIDVDVFDGPAYSCAEYLSKGRLVGVEGCLALHEWRDEQDRARKRYSVIGRVQFLDRPPERRAEAEADGEPEPTGAREPELALAA